jgi:hypothetical protein
MLDSKAFWMAQGVAMVVFHLVGIGAAIVSNAGFSHPLALLWLLIVGAHVGECLLAHNALKGQGVPRSIWIPKTLVFGFIWWLPRSRGTFTR